MPTLATVVGTWINNPTDDPAYRINAGQVRRADAALIASPGIGYGLEVTVSGSDQVTVQPGAWIISGEPTLTGAGVYRGGLGAAASESLDPRNATYGRIDLVVARQYDPEVVGSHTEKYAQVEVITGVPSSSPVAPPLPALAIELAKIPVPVSGGGAATVDTSGRETVQAAGFDQIPKIATGVKLMTPTAADTAVTSAVTFPVGRFTSAPRVVATPYTFADADMTVGVSNVTTAGFNLTFRRDSATGTNVNWIAIQEA